MSETRSVHASLPYRRIGTTKTMYVVHLAAREIALFPKMHVRSAPKALDALSMRLRTSTESFRSQVMSEPRYLNSLQNVMYPPSASKGLVSASW